MNKCFKCGTEYEGKFCPECGAKHGETKQSTLDNAKTEISNFTKKSKSWVIAHKTLSIVIAAVLLTGIILSIVLPLTVGNVFRANRVAQINIGDSYKQVEKILGKPYESTKISYTYYSKNLVRKLNQMQKLEEKMENISNLSDLEKLTEKADKLQAEIDKLEHKEIQVLFVDGKVESVVFDKHAKKDSANDEKTVKTATLCPEIYLKNEETTEFYAKVYYTDGSYQLTQNFESEVSDIFMGNNFLYSDYYVIVNWKLDQNHRFETKLKCYSDEREYHKAYSRYITNLTLSCLISTIIIILVLVAIVIICRENSRIKKLNIIDGKGKNQSILVFTIIYCANFLFYLFLLRDIARWISYVPFITLIACPIVCIVLAAKRLITTRKIDKTTAKPYKTLLLIYIALLLIPWIAIITTSEVVRYLF